MAKDLSALAAREVGPLNEELGKKKLQPLPAVEPSIPPAFLS